MRFLLVASFLLSVVAPAAEALQVRPTARIELELVTEPGLPITASKQWFDVLKQMDLSSLRIRSARS